MSIWWYVVLGAFLGFLVLLIDALLGGPTASLLARLARRRK